MPADLHPDIKPLAFLLGTWTGSGRGEYPTIQPFGYEETVTIAHVGKPWLAYSQRTRHADDGRPLHTEAGYWRFSPATGTAELVVAQPTGIVEVHEGPVSGSAVELRMTHVARTGSAKEITEVRRRVRVEAERMHYVVDMAAVGVPLTFHLEAKLSRTEE